MRANDFDYPLPPELIAQSPLAKRDQSRLLVLRRADGRVEHRHFSDLADFLHPSDVLVLNDSRVVPARLRGSKEGSGGEFEILLLEENAPNDWWVMLRPGKRVRAGTRLLFHDAQGQAPHVQASVLEKNSEGHCRLRFEGTPDIVRELDRLGEVPLPPYIERTPGQSAEIDRERYQTVFAEKPGSVAAPTAGLHFTEELLARLHGRGVESCRVTLHVGLGTFAPVKVENLAEHPMHAERFELPAATAQLINAARANGRRIVAVGTTTLRVLESVAAENNGLLVPTAGRTRIFIYPPFDFRILDALVTNFHLPKSTLLMLVSAFAAPRETHGRGLILAAYAEAVRERYRFFSYGDAMLII